MGELGVFKSMRVFTIWAQSGGTWVLCTPIRRSPSVIM